MPFRCEVIQAVEEVWLQQKKSVSTFLASITGGLHDEYTFLASSTCGLHGKNEKEQLRLQGCG